MSTINCVKCKEPIDADLESCPHCSERVTQFQRTYSSKLLDGKYQILDRLGLGGMGEIFKVRHIHLNELRVIKIMRPNIAADDQGLQRFLQEARTSTMIKHKNLAMLYDFSTLDDGSYYMVWEFIDGTNIQKWIAQNGALPSRLTIEIAIQALTGLEHLHAMDLIHRDISPENIMLSQDNKGKLLVKVIDFGIAKQLTEGDGGHGLTQTGMFLGKLKYASPEQAGFIKENEQLDARSDLYSFGIVLYEMLAGRAPFQATNPQGYILKHVTEKPPAIASLNPDAHVPPALEAIVQKSLEKNRDDRFASAAEMTAALEHIRNQVQPDPKFGLGEKMVTLSGAQTLVDAVRPGRTGGGAFTGGTGAAPTVQEGRVGPTGTKASSNDATVMEPGMAAASAARRGADATVLERTTKASDEATVMERFGTGGADATMIEPKGSWPAGSEATVIESKYRPGEGKRPGAMIGVAAGVVVLLLAAGGWFVFKRPASSPVVSTQSAPAAGTVVNAGTAAASATSATSATVGVGQGLLLLSATPYGEIQKITDGNGREVTIPDEDRSTPARIELAPGRYEVTMVGPPDSGKVQTFPVEIHSGLATPVKMNPKLGEVDYEKLQQELGQQ
jgi:tRNA A-37 threonylcarbamoyl transferase component Bud32